MCGIIGIIGKGEAAPLLVEGLKRLEYRGYDSAGIATLVGGAIERRRAEGKLENLSALLQRRPLPGTIGIGHTRWATHGAPNENNAHPHATDRVAVVHNGIIENFPELRRELEAAGCKFATDTDTEVVPHLITTLLNIGNTPQQAMAAAMSRLKGAFSLAVLFADRPDLLIGARRGSPLAVGYGDGEMYLGSDAIGLAPLTRRIAYLEEDDWVEVTSTGATFHDASGKQVIRPVRETAFSAAVVAKGNYRHFMLKEIHEQPGVIGDTLHNLINPTTRSIRLADGVESLGKIPRLTILACGTSYHAAIVAKYWFEQVAKLPVEIDIASEFRYRATVLPPGGLTLGISQSGETADTLAAFRFAKSQGQRIAALVNVAESTMAREVDLAWTTVAGPEIGVASTKTFTAQLTVLACLAIAAGRARGVLDERREKALAGALIEIPSRVNEILGHDEKIAAVAQEIAQARDVLFFGRGTAYPVALEGALKLKELSYIHAEGYAAGEMKHGPIALIDESVPVIAIAPSDALFEKTVSNMQEVKARGGRIILVSDRPGIDRAGTWAARTLEVPSVDPFVAPILYSIPVQLLAYHAAVAKGTDVDQPRNLAKSVTVE